MRELREFVIGHKWSVLCTAAGLLCGVLLLTIGFWRTLLLCMTVGCGFVLGRELDKRGAGRMKDWIRRMFNRIFSKEHNA